MLKLACFVKRHGIIAAWSFLVAVCLITVFFISYIPGSWQTFASRRWLLVLVLALMPTLYLVRALVAQSRPRFTAVDFLFFILCLSFLLAGVVYQDRGSNVYAIAESWLYSYFFLSVVLLGVEINRNSYKFVAALIYLVAVSAFFYGLMTVTLYVFAVSDNFSKLDQLIPWGFVNIRYWSHIATWTIPLLPISVLVGRLKNHSMWRFSMSITGALWWWILILSSSRGSAFGIFISGLLVVLLFGRLAVPWLATVAKHFLLGVLAWFLLSIVIPEIMFDNVEVRQLKGDSSGRVILWLEAWEMSLVEFPFGMGVQSWLTHESITDNYLNSKKYGHPHNMYLMWAAEYGWSLLGIMILCFLGLLKRLWERRQTCLVESSGELPIMLVGFAASVGAALLHAGVSAVFLAPASMIMGFLVLSGFWALVLPSPIVISRSVTGGFRVAIALILALHLSLSMFWMLEIYRYQGAMELDKPYYQEHVKLGYLPRFWFHGYFPRSIDQQ